MLTAGEPTRAFVCKLKIVVKSVISLPCDDSCVVSQNLAVHCTSLTQAKCVAMLANPDWITDTQMPELEKKKKKIFCTNSWKPSQGETTGNAGNPFGPVNLISLGAIHHYSYGQMVIFDDIQLPFQRRTLVPLQRRTLVFQNAKQLAIMA